MEKGGLRGSGVVSHEVGWPLVGSRQAAAGVVGTLSGQIYHVSEQRSKIFNTSNEKG